ncbi:hypothetical protein WSM22_40740 [Cytophagales bacterium WSM2-2]|nr:hypothetical protein WSM22_40740 [Cytophagales bacterium WSM2-2]
MSLIGIFILYEGKSDLSRRLNRETGKSDSLADANRTLERLSRERSEKIATSEKVVKDLKERIDVLNTVALAKQNEIELLKKIQGWQKKELDELADLKRRSKELETQLVSYRESSARLQKEKNDLLVSVQELKSENARKDFELKSSLRSPEQVRLETVRGKRDKLVVRAGRVQRIKVIFDTTAEPQELEYKITSPDGTLLPAGQGTPMTKIIDQNVKVSGRAQVYKKVEMTYNSPRLIAGTYVIEVLAKGVHLANLEIRLR